MVARRHIIAESSGFTVQGLRTGCEVKFPRERCWNRPGVEAV